jgi:hypothetical protein
MLDYCVGFTNNYLRDHPNAKRIPAVISLVVHVGPKGLRWNAPLELTELFDLDLAIRTTLGDHLPRLRYHLDDVNALDTQALMQRPLTPDTLIVLFLERTTADNPNLVTDLAPIMPLLRARSETPGGLEALRTYATYLEAAGKMSPADLELFADQFGPAAKEVIVTTADMLRAEGEARAEARWRAASPLEQLTEKFGALDPGPEASSGACNTPAHLSLWPVPNARTDARRSSEGVDGFRRRGRRGGCIGHVTAAGRRSSAPSAVCSTKMPAGERLRQISRTA